MICVVKVMQKLLPTHSWSYFLSPRFLLSIDRRQSVSEAEDTVDLAIEYKNKYGGLVVGVDLSGDYKVC